MSKYLPSVCKTLFAFILFVTIKVAAQPTITSFTPASGAVGTSITITGTNFNATAINNIVYFGAVKATVTAGTTTSLTVTVPVGATYKPISVLNNVTHLTGYSSKPFIITFTNPFGTGIPANFYKPKVDFTTNVAPYSVAFSDVDGDGKADLVVATQNNAVSVLRNTSTPGNIIASSFAAKVDLIPGSTPYSVATGDVDGDGKPDIVVANSGSRTISVFRNTSSSGSISAAATVDFPATGSFPTSVAIGDVDGDGKPDLIIVNGGSSTVSVFRNTSTSGSIDASSFAAKIDFAAVSTPYAVAVGDVDGDGKPDLVTANQNGANISVLRNTSTSGNISFAVNVNFTTGSVPRSVAIGDMDGDGKPDLVVANNSSNSISVLRNTSTSGSISMAAKVDFTTGNAPYSVAIGDVDGDGKPDFVTANNGTPYSMSVLRNTSTPGNISAAAKVDFTTGTAPISAAIGDVDGDGIPEIVIANSGSISVSVFQIDLSVTPVTLTDIKAYQQNAGVKIEWTAQQEINIERYEIERSENGQQFIKLGSVQAKGNSSALIKYSLFDPNPFSGVGFYRIKTIETGQITYSRVLKVNIRNNSAHIITVSPNPVIGNIVSLQVNLPKGNYFISLTNKLGQQVVTKMMHHEGGSATEGIEFPNAVTPGIYQLRLTGGGINITRQLIKN
ncbi:MAG TPA: FG-GAP-like repeat-containing protein [Chitinophagaceae bacterium]|nr:FG-GAP-like repeat-containing protein [Chitinophagaceae bacterium]